LEGFVFLFQFGVGGQKIFLGLIQVILQLLHLFLESAYLFLGLDDSFFQLIEVNLATIIAQI
jgi:hypothetical protein